MKCRKCQLENPHVVGFCFERGTRLELLCPNCKAPNQPNVKSGGKYSHSATSESHVRLPLRLIADEKPAKIQKFLHAGVSDKILFQWDKIEGKRGQVTITFSDMMGVSWLMEELGPEETLSVMDQVFDFSSTRSMNSWTRPIS
jgi:hypothetical protein